MGRYIGLSHNDEAENNLRVAMYLVNSCSN